MPPNGINRWRQPKHWRRFGFTISFKFLFFHFWRLFYVPDLCSRKSFKCKFSSLSAPTKSLRVSSYWITFSAITVMFGVEGLAVSICSSYLLSCFACWCLFYFSNLTSVSPRSSSSLPLSSCLVKDFTMCSGQAHRAMAVNCFSSLGESRLFRMPSTLSSGPDTRGSWMFHMRHHWRTAIARKEMIVHAWWKIALE